MFTPSIIGLALICVLSGVALALQFRVLILIPVISVVIAMAVSAGLAHGDAVGSLGLRAVIIALSLQFGYSLGLGVWYANALFRLNRNPYRPLTSSLPQRHLR